MTLTARACVLVALIASPLAAQTSPAPTAPTASPATTAKYNLDTPIEDIVANPAAKAVLDKDLPGMTTNANYDMFKSMSLNALSQMSDKMTPALLEKVKADLALVK